MKRKSVNNLPVNSKIVLLVVSFLLLFTSRMHNKLAETAIYLYII